MVWNVKKRKETGRAFQDGVVGVLFQSDVIHASNGMKQNIKIPSASSPKTIAFSSNNKKKTQHNVSYQGRLQE